MKSICVPVKTSFEELIPAGVGVERLEQVDRVPDDADKCGSRTEQRSHLLRIPNGVHGENVVADARPRHIRNLGWV